MAARKEIEDYLCQTFDRQLALSDLPEEERAAAEKKKAAAAQNLAALSDPDTALENPYSKSLYKRIAIKDLFGEDQGRRVIGKQVVVGGWVKTGRTADKGAFAFLELNDGTTPINLQTLVPKDVQDPDTCRQTGTCVVVQGEVKAAPEGAKQAIEVHSTKILHFGSSEAASYPIAKSKLSLEFLREKIHLRVRTNTISAVQRIRNCLAYATHKFFQKSGFQYVHTPIITASDCEGAGEMFQVTTLLSAADAAGSDPITPEKIAELKAASSAAGGEVAEIKKAQKEMDAEAKAADKPRLTAALEKLTAAKKAVEDAEKSVCLPIPDLALPHALYAGFRTRRQVHGQDQIEQ